jgi:lipocalin
MEPIVGCLELAVFIMTNDSTSGSPNADDSFRLSRKISISRKELDRRRQIGRRHLN